jgi:hypothetical protein
LSLARRSEQTTGAIVGETRSSDHSEDRTAFGDGIIESLQQQDSGTFSDQQALPTMVEGATAALGREGSKLRESHLGEEAIWPRDPTSESRIAAPCGEIATCDRQGIEGRCTGGIESDRTAAKFQRSLKSRCG